MVIHCPTAQEVPIYCVSACKFAKYFKGYTPFYMFFIKNNDKQIFAKYRINCRHWAGSSASVRNIPYLSVRVETYKDYL
jgi:hypothetical protein